MSRSFTAAAVFTVYAFGACPTIYVGDSGELVTAVALLGIPHPTGYPLYVLLGKAWTMIFPFGSVAWRMSIFSAACGALACGLLPEGERPRVVVHRFEVLVPAADDRHDERRAPVGCEAIVDRGEHVAVLRVDLVVRLRNPADGDAPAAGARLVLVDVLVA